MSSMDKYMDYIVTVIRIHLSNCRWTPGESMDSMRIDGIDMSTHQVSI